MRLFQQLFGLLLFSLMLHYAEAQPSFSTIDYSTEDGLPDNRITCIMKDSEGFMWFGTWGGVSRFDGQKFTTYRAQPGDRSNLQTNRIVKIVEDKDGFLWLRSHDAQVYRFDKKKETFFYLPSLIKEANTKKIAFNYVVPTDEGTVWVISNDHGLFAIRNNGPNGQPTYKEYSSSAPAPFRISANDLKIFHPVKNNEIWLGTKNGMALLSKESSQEFRVKEFPNLPAPDMFQHIIEDGPNYWFVGNKGNLLLYNGSSKNFKSYPVAASSLNGLMLMPDKRTLYITTQDGQLIRFNTASATIEKFTMSGRQVFKSLNNDAAGNIWIEALENGIVRFNPSNNSFTAFAPTSEPDYNRSFKGFDSFLDGDGRLWALMKGSGLGYFNKKTDRIEPFTLPTNDPRRPFTNNVNSFYYDPQGVLWISNAGGGLHRLIFHRNNFQQYLVSNDASHSANEVRSVYVDHRQRLWLSTKSGILQVVKDHQPVSVLFDNQPVTGIGSIYCLLEDRQDNIRMGTRDNGLFRATPVNNEGTHYRLQQFQSTNAPGSLLSNRVFSILQDAQARIWVGTFDGGLHLIEQQGDQVFFRHSGNGLSNYPTSEFRRIRKLALDGEENMWIATTEGLLVMRQNAANNQFEFKSYKKIAGDKNSLGDNDIQFIYKDGKSAMWLGTAGGGLNKAIGDDPFKQLSFANYATREGLRSDYILNSIADNKGHLWLASPNNLARFDGTNFRNFDSYDGLQAEGFSEGASVRLDNGEIIVGTLNGYLAFSPSTIQDQKIKANLALTHLQVNGIDVNTGDSSNILPNAINTIPSITLEHDQNILSIDYSILDYRFPDNALFAYRLKGFDDEWHNNKELRRASYTNLSPGRYVFEVKVLNDDRYSNSPVKQLVIIILPPWWKTWWAYVIYALVAVIILAIIYRVSRTLLGLRQRIAVEKEVAEVKTKFFTNISHELRTPLTLIKGPLDAVAKTEPLSNAGRDNLLIARKNTARMQRFINQLLDIDKVQSGEMMLHITQVDMVLFTRQVTEFFYEALKAKNIHIQVHAFTSDVMAWIDADKIETVLYNILGNAIKFSPENSTITLQLKQPPKDPSMLMIELSDEGPGVPEDELHRIFNLYFESKKQQQLPMKGSGIGLSIAREFMELHRGKIYARNNEGKGLTIVMELWKDKSHLDANRTTILPATSPFIIEAINGDPVEPETLTQNEQVDESQLVLLVEDNTELSSFLAQQLRSQFRVEVANDGLQGLEKAQALLPDIVVSDIMMPNMDGISLLDKLKNNSITSHIPVILLSARYDIQSQISGLQYGADYYITKPFNTDFVKASINNLLAQRKKLFYQLQETKVGNLPLPEVTITSSDEKFLSEVIRFVEDRLQESDFDIDAIATSVNMSRSAFYKKFKSLTNMAPLEFVNEMRLKRARQYFDAGEKNISDVAYQVGFTSPKYFSTCFRKFYDCTPSDYVKKVQLGVE